MPRLTYTAFDGATQVVELKPGVHRVGRDPGNDVQIDELAISGVHCQLAVSESRVMVQDLGSVTGTFVDGELIEGPRELQVGQVLNLGTLSLRLAKESGMPPVGEALKSVKLPDGTMSCLRHTERRARFECPECFDLACEECVRQPEGATGSFCPVCGAASRSIEWSAWDEPVKHLVSELTPKSVKTARSLFDKVRKRWRGDS